MSILQSNVTNGNGIVRLADDEIPFGMNARGNAATDNGPDSPDEYDARPDATFPGYSRGRVSKGLDRLADDVEDCYVESGAEVLSMEKSLREAVASALLQLPDGTDFVIRREQRWATWEGMKRSDVWNVVVLPARPTQFPPPSVPTTFSVNVRGVDRIARAVIAKWRRREDARDAQAVEMDSMCETDSGPRRPAA